MYYVSNYTAARTLSNQRALLKLRTSDVPIGAETPVLDQSMWVEGVVSIADALHDLMALNNLEPGEYYLYRVISKMNEDPPCVELVLLDHEDHSYVGGTRRRDPKRAEAELQELLDKQRRLDKQIHQMKLELDSESYHRLGLAHV